MKPNALTKGFRIAGRTFANALRKHLPDAVFGSSAQSVRARAVLAKTAKETSLQMTAVARSFLQGPTIRDAVRSGQVQASKAINVTLGGVNTQLVDKLTKDLAPALAKAADSPRQFLSKTLREATAYAKAAEGEVFPLAGTSRTMSETLLREALGETSYKKTVRAMMEDLGLDKGDRVLFLSGYRMEAEAYAELVTRTRTMEALNEAKAEELQDNGYQFIKITEHPVEDERDICFFLQGKVWALTENDLGIPLLPEEYGLPPWHPNCGHSFGAWQPKFETEAAIQAAIDAHDDDEAQLAAWAGEIRKPKE